MRSDIYLHDVSRVEIVRRHYLSGSATHATILHVYDERRAYSEIAFFSDAPLVIDDRTDRVQEVAA